MLSVCKSNRWKGKVLPFDRGMDGYVKTWFGHTTQDVDWFLEIMEEVFLFFKWKMEKKAVKEVGHDLTIYWLKLVC